MSDDASGRDPNEKSLVLDQAARTLLHGGESDEGRAVQERALELDPSSLSIVMRYVRFVRELGDYEAARTAYGRFTDRNPDDTNALSHYAWFCVDPEAPAAQRDVDEGLRVARLAAERVDFDKTEPWDVNNGPRILDRLAWTFLHAGEPASAAEMERRGFELEPTNYESVNRYVRLLRALEDYGAVRDVYRRYTDANPDHATALNAYAWFCVDPEAPAAQRDVDEGLRVARLAAEKTRFQNTDVLDTLAWASFHAGQTDDAVSIETRALELLERQAQVDPSDRTWLQESLQRFRGK